MLVFYRAVLESLVRFGVAVWFGNLSVQLRSKLLRLVQTAGKIIRVRQLPSLQSIYEQAALIQAQKNVLNGEFVVLPSGRRYKEPKWKYIRFKKSFVPASTKNVELGSEPAVIAKGFTVHTMCALCNVSLYVFCGHLCFLSQGVKT